MTPSDDAPTHDSALAAEPAAYWTGVAYQSLIAFTRARQAEFGFTQPQFWLLRSLSEFGDGRTVPQLRQAISAYLRPEDDLAGEAEVLLERAWLRVDAAGRLWITDAGQARCAEFRAHAPAIRAQIHAGIDDADYVTALTVLQRMIRNTGVTAPAH